MMFRHRRLNLPLVLTYSLLLNSGTSCIWPLVTMYLHNYLGQSLTMAGGVLLVMSLLMMLGNYLGGYLFDRWSAYRTSLIFITLSTLGVIAMIFFHGWPAFALLLMPIGFGDGVNLTLSNSYASAIKGHSSRYIFNVMYVGLNLGVVIGTAIVGYLLKYGLTILMSVTTVFYLALLILTILFFNVPLHHRQRQHISRRSHRGTKLLMTICALSFVIYLSYSLWETVMPVHMSNLGISFGKYSTIWTVNGLMIVLFQVPINRLFRRIKITQQIAFGITVFALSFFWLLFARQYWMFIAIMAFLTVGEIIGLPSIPAWLNTLALGGEKGRYQADFNTFMTLGRAVGPLFDGAVIEALGYSTLFSFSGAIVIILLGIVLLSSRNVNA